MNTSGTSTSSSPFPAEPDLDLFAAAYDYALPEDLIAQAPAERRDGSRLLVYDRHSQQIRYQLFHQLPDWLRPGDLLVFNNTRVMPARLYGAKSHTGTRFEFLLLRPLPAGEWLMIAKHSRRVQPGYQFLFPEGVTGQILAKERDGQCRIRFSLAGDDFRCWLGRHGEMPLPPYISQTDARLRERYQTVYGQEEGSVAASTAGLHFTDELLQALERRGIQTAHVTLHIGLGTFSPVRHEQIEAHAMHTEAYVLPAETAELLNQQRQENRRIVAVGTTVTRTLETVYRRFGSFQPDAGETRLFIYPGQSIKAIDALMTNFHLPRTTLMMLVAAWIGREPLLALYREAIARQYRFFSFGDSMLLF